MTFSMNGIVWHTEFVSPHSGLLMDRTGVMTVATTDPETYCIYLSDELYGAFLTKVLVHELGHCVMISYGLLRDIHTMVYPEYWISMEEWVCNFIANYGMEIFQQASSILGYKAIDILPYELGKLIE